MTFLIILVFWHWQPPVTNTSFAERTRETMRLLRDHLLGAVVSQRNIRDVYSETDVDNNDSNEAGSRNFTMETFRRGVIEFFCPTRQQWAIFWEEADAHQNILDFMSSAALMSVLIEEGHRRILRRLQTDGHACSNNDQGLHGAGSSARSASSSSRPAPVETYRVTSNSDLLPPAESNSEMQQAIQTNEIKHSRRQDVAAGAASNKRAKKDVLAAKVVHLKNSKLNTKAHAFHNQDEALPLATRGGRGSRGGKRKGPVRKQNAESRNCRQSQALFEQHNAVTVPSVNETPPPPPPPVLSNNTGNGLVYGQMIVMPSYAQENDLHPLFSFIGMTNRGLFQFYVGPSVPRAVFDVNEVILYYNFNHYLLVNLNLLHQGCVCMNDLARTDVIFAVYQMGDAQPPPGPTTVTLDRDTVASIRQRHFSTMTPDLFQEFHNRFAALNAMWIVDDDTYFTRGVLLHLPEM